MTRPISPKTPSPVKTTKYKEPQSDQEQLDDFDFNSLMPLEEAFEDKKKKKYYHTKKPKTPNTMTKLLAESRYDSRASEIDPVPSAVEDYIAIRELDSLLGSDYSSSVESKNICRAGVGIKRTLKEYNSTRETKLLVTELINQFNKMNIKIISLDCDDTIFKTSSDEFYPIKNQAPLKLKAKHDREFLIKTWFADYEFLEIFLKECNKSGIATGLSSRQSLNILKDAFIKVGLWDYVKDYTISKPESITDQEKIRLTANMIERNIRAGEFALHLDDHQGILKGLNQSPIGNKIFTHLVGEGSFSASNEGLTFSRWQLILEDLRQKEADLKIGKSKSEVGKSPSKAAAFSPSRRYVEREIS